MASLTLINAGVHTVGNYTDTDVPVINAIDSNVLAVKTLVNGVWKSWTKGTETAFQGFNTMDTGRGYVLVTDATSIVEIPDSTEMDIFDMPAIIGDNFIAVPNNIPAGDNSRIDTNVMKTVISGQWKSWTKGTDDAFQGFLELDRNKGYYSNVTSVKEDTSYNQFDGQEGVLPYALAVGVATEFMFNETELNTVDEGLRFALYSRRINL